MLCIQQIISCYFPNTVDCITDDSKIKSNVSFAYIVSRLAILTFLEFLPQIKLTSLCFLYVRQFIFLSCPELLNFFDMTTFFQFPSDYSSWRKLCRTPVFLFDFNTIYLFPVHTEVSMEINLSMKNITHV